MIEEIDKQREMSDSAGSGESGGVAGAGQDAEADNEPPQQAPPLPQSDHLEVGETSEYGAPPAAKRLKMSGNEQGLGQVTESIKMHGEAPAQAGLLLADPAPPAQGKIPGSDRDYDSGLV